MPEYKGKTDPSKREQKTLIDNIDNLIASAKNGDLRKEASKLDEELKVAMINFVFATDAEKSNNLSLLNAQQIKARNFAKKVDAKNTEILIKMKELAK